jgi:hypothetical protein
VHLVNDGVIANAIPIVFFGATMVVLAAAVSARWGKRGRPALWIALVIYLGLLAWVTLSLGRGDPADGAAINLTPLQEIRRAIDSGQGGPRANLIALLARGSWAARIATATFWGLLISVAIEATQLGLGRVADVDDLILNTTGALLGGLLAVAVTGAMRALTPNYDDPRASSSAGRAADF